jgi:hypothetical protein
VKDVSDLGYVHDLNLSMCQNIIDVSSLGHVDTLNISHCSGVTDTRALSNVRRLNTNFCDSIMEGMPGVNARFVSIPHKLATRGISEGWYR